MTDGLHQVGFAQADSAADEQRIELTPGGLSHCQGRRMGHAAVGPNHKTAEYITRIQPRQHPPRSTRGNGVRSGNRIRGHGLKRLGQIL